MARKLDIRPVDIEKTPEELFKATYYAASTALSLYVVKFSGKYTFFDEPCKVYNETLKNGASSYFLYLEKHYEVFN